jgi:C1q domain
MLKRFGLLLLLLCFGDRALAQSPLTWTNSAGQQFTYYMQGNGPNWVLVAPTGSAGLIADLYGPFLQAINSASYAVVGLHIPGADGGEEDYGWNNAQLGPFISYIELTYGYNEPACYAQSRGGLQILNFLEANPTGYCARVAALYPVTDPEVYPGVGSALYAAYGVSAWTTALENQYSPNVNASALSGKVPIQIWHGNADTTAPEATNSSIFAPAAGASLLTLQNFGHEPNYLNEDIVNYLTGMNPSTKQQLAPAQLTADLGQTIFAATLQSSISLPAGGPTQIFTIATAPVNVTLDRAGNYNPTTGRFTAGEAGVYHFNATVLFNATTSDELIWAGFYLNGNAFAVPTVISPGGNEASTIGASAWLNPGDYVDLQAYVGSATVVSDNPFATIWTASKGASN